MNTDRGSRGTAVHMRYLSSSWRCVVYPTLRPLCPLQGISVRSVEEARWAPVPVWMGMETKKSIAPLWRIEPGNNSGIRMATVDISSGVQYSEGLIGTESYDRILGVFFFDRDLPFV